MLEKKYYEAVVRPHKLNIAYLLKEKKLILINKHLVILFSENCLMEINLNCIFQFIFKIDHYHC